MYRLAQQMLTASGYQHYEISNYALPGYQCRHNRIYWQNLAYYGFGMGAASYLFRQRFTRPRITKEYYQWVKENKEAIAAGKPNQIIIPDSDISNYSNSHQDLLLETIMLGLRLTEGLNISELITKFGAEILNIIWKTLQPYYQQGWVEILDSNGLPIQVNSGETIAAYSHIRLTDPEGFLFSNTILSTLFSELGTTE
jgi:coproporphyrinogen III oxidase-like Fe-S oxidoreductase